MHMPFGRKAQTLGSALLAASSIVACEAAPKERTYNLPSRESIIFVNGVPSEAKDALLCRVTANSPKSKLVWASPLEPDVREVEFAESGAEQFFPCPVNDQSHFGSYTIALQADWGTFNISVGTKSGELWTPLREEAIEPGITRLMVTTGAFGHTKGSGMVL